MTTVQSDISITFRDLVESRVFLEFYGVVREFTGVFVALTDASYSPQQRLSAECGVNPLCQLIRSSAKGMAGCLETDRRYLEQADQCRQGVHYLCHAGLIDLAVPIFSRGKHVATLNCGQALPQPPSEEGFKIFYARTQEYGLPKPLLRKAYFQSPYISEEKLEKLLTLCVLFANYCCEMGQRLKEASQESNRTEIEKALEYLRRSFREEISLSIVAEHVGLSPAYFSKSFSRVTGVTFTHCVQSLRIEEAKRLLWETQMSVSAIAMEVGFGNFTHFNRIFKSLEQCTPGQYRKLRLAEPETDSSPDFF